METKYGLCKRSEEVKIQGPAGHEFDSFQELATYSLDTLLNWKNYAQTFITRPVFEYKHQDVSDEVYKLAEEKLQEKQEKKKSNPKSPQNHEKQDNVIKDRKSDEPSIVSTNWPLQMGFRIRP